MERTFKNIPVSLKNLLHMKKMSKNKNTKTKVYYSPFQKNTNKNTNVLIVFPKR